MPQLNTVQAPILLNVASRLAIMARDRPDAPAVIMAARRGSSTRRGNKFLSFRELDEDSDRIAGGLERLGVTKGMQLALLVKPGADFITLVYALFKAGAIAILIDPGMGLRGVIDCLAEAKPQGFIALGAAQALCRFFAKRFPDARLRVTVGRRWFVGGVSLDTLRRGPPIERMAATHSDDPAAIIFTSGSTGPAKGVEYTHGNFDSQATEIRDHYQIQPGGIDLAAFPLFGLFNSAMGVTTVVPDMDASRPAKVRPQNIVRAITEFEVTQSFASPAVWNRVGPYCRRHGIRLATLRRVMAAGAPVSPRTLECLLEIIHPDGEVYTPYGATEALPVSSIAAREVVAETRSRTAAGAGTCVGRCFAHIEWKVIRDVSGPIRAMADAEELEDGQIGELIVRGPVVTRRYVTRLEANATAKIADGTTFWHRMGDVGYLDEQGRFWYCGRMSQRVWTQSGPLDTECCEAIFNQHRAVARCALVGVGPRGAERPVIVVEGSRNLRLSARRWKLIVAELRELARAHPVTEQIDDFLLHRGLPVDTRHNVKIAREKLAVWAAKQKRHPGALS